MLSTIVTGFINSAHGWAVADQFKTTFDQEESFEEQNVTALHFIHKSIWDLLQCSCFSEEAHDELQEYYDELEDFLAK